MTLSEALDIVYGRRDWDNPIAPYVVSGTTQTPYEAYKKLKMDYQLIVNRMIGNRFPSKDEE